MKHTWLMPCLLAMALAAIVLIAAGVEAGTLVAVGAAIACPLMMLLMMGGGMHRLTRQRDAGHKPADTSPSEDDRTLVSEV